jgi:dTDP-4-amino-4,6-dideoxygalactose transaminase
MIPFYEPNVTDADIEAVAAVMRSGWLTSGGKVIEFEKRMAEYLGAKHCIAVSSGTAALKIVLAALKTDWCEVITTPLTFTATAEAIVRARCRPVFVDIAEDSLNVDPTAVREAVNPNTLAIVPVGIGGIPAVSAELMKIERPIIEDAAHTFGGKFMGRHAHAFAFASCYSFHANKNLTTNGEGGMIVTENDPLAKHCRLARQHGMNSTAWTSRGGGRDYDVMFPGQKANMPDVCAAMGLTQLERFDAMQAVRKYLCWEYHRILQNILGIDEDIAPIAVTKDIESSACHLYQVLLPEWMDRDRVLNLMAERGVWCGVHYKPLYRMTAWKDDPAKYPNCEKIWTRLLSLPLFVDITSEQQEFVGIHLLEALKEEKRLCGNQLSCVS